MESFIVRMAALIFTIFAVFFFFVACGSSDDEEGGSSGDPEPCVIDNDCTDDGLFCSGAEICVDSSCVGTGDPCAGFTPICNEVMDTCDTCKSNAECDDGLFCSGVEGCNGASGQCFTTGNPCGGATPSCNEVMDICE